MPVKQAVSWHRHDHTWVLERSLPSRGWTEESPTKRWGNQLGCRCDETLMVWTLANQRGSLRGVGEGGGGETREGEAPRLLGAEEGMELLGDTGVCTFWF